MALLLAQIFQPGPALVAAAVLALVMALGSGAPTLTRPSPSSTCVGTGDEVAR